MSPTLTAYVNGQFMPLDAATIHIEDRGFQFADGIYEVVACLDGHFLDLDAHLARLQRSCEAVQIPLPCSLDDMADLIQQTYERNPYSDAMVYVQITRGVAPRSHLPHHQLTPTLIITSRHLPQPSDEKVATGVKGITLQDIRWKHCEIKSIALLASVMGKQEAHARGADEAFWLNEQGHVLEGCSTNILAIIDGVLVTHPLDRQVLGGITRNMAIAVAKVHAMHVEERPWTLDEVGISEMMMSSTTNAVMPITTLNEKAVGDGKAGVQSLQIRRWMIEEMERLRAA
ncbi:MAG: aminotransferase class IV [Zetaproteobacteria bacterium]|nr:aminotransferase class IV [Zetaproteobacteria bacterium]